ncbi:hypothetical protein HMI54_000392 [Coelomomyces lativittatus]|nr:hypothetical protein HMI54_000392 [Coelomomyces lativittatus]
MKKNVIKKSELIEWVNQYRILKQKECPLSRRSFTKAIKMKSKSLRSLTWPLTIQRHAYLKDILEAYPYRTEMDFNFDTPFENNISIPLTEPIYIHAPKLGRHYALKVKKNGVSIMNHVFPTKDLIHSPFPTFLEPIWGFQPEESASEEVQSQNLMKKYELTNLYRPDPLNESVPVFSDLIYAILPDRRDRKFHYSLSLQESSMISKLKDENFAFMSDVVTEQCRHLFKYLNTVLAESPPDKILNWADILLAADKSGMRLGFNYI